MTEQEIKQHKAQLLIDVPEAVAKERLMKFAEKMDLTYQDLLTAANDFQKNGEYFFGPVDEWGTRGKYEGKGIYNNFWEDYALVTNKPVTDKGNFFTCSC